MGRIVLPLWVVAPRDRDEELRAIAYLEESLEQTIRRTRRLTRLIVLAGLVGLGSILGVLLVGAR